MFKEFIYFFSLRKEPMGEAVRWLVLTLVVSLMPVWGSALIFMLFKQPFNLDTFTSKAEFAIYAASYLAGAAHIVVKNYKHKNFPLRPWFNIFTSSTVLIVVICFAAVYSNCFNSNALPLDTALLRKVTLWSFAFSLVLAFVTLVEDQVLSNPDIRRINEAQFEKFNDDFDQLGGAR